MMSYVHVLQRLPEEWRLPMVEFADAIEARLRNQLAVRRQDFDELRASVDDLARAQARTEAVQALAEKRLGRLEEAVTNLAAAQARTEERVEELAAAQARTEERVGRLEEAVTNLAAAQARTEERVGRLEEAVTNLAAAQARTEERVGRLEEAVTNLAAAQARTEQRVEELAAAQARTEQRVEELAAAQTRTEAALAALTLRVTDLAAVQQEMRADIGKLKGWALESEYVNKAPAVFGTWLRRVRVVLPGSLDAATEDRLLARLTDAEFQEVLRLDVALRGRLKHAAEHPEVYLAVEVSGVIDRGDVERAQRRAGLLRKAGLVAVPVVAGEEVTEGAATLLREVPVAVTLNGHCEGWEKALAAALP